MTTLIIIAIIVIIAFAAVGIYNGLVKLRNTSEQAWSDVDVQLKRRYDLIPNLVETVKGYASHEKETFEKVVQARNQAMGASSPGEKAQAENFLQSTLKSLFALAEAYPELKANQNFLDLQDELSNIEEQIQLARRYYNAVVRDLNTKIESVPSDIVANMFHFEKREYFELDSEEQRETPKVDFN
ncbi:MAG: LemA family protein [Thermodesulfobacteriales bacterium]|nr:MAG: LemA family protein [Thermodesulfobacteriales bacterium]